MTEESLGGGGNALEAVRAGDTVRRARDAGSEFAARVLACAAGQRTAGPRITGGPTTVSFLALATAIIAGRSMPGEAPATTRK